MLAICVLLGGSLDNADYYAYEQNYYEMVSGGFSFDFEPGYQLATYVFSRSGATYQLFCFAVAVVGILLLVSTIRHFTDRPSVVLVMYAAYPLFWDYVQVRNFLAMSIITFGARYLLDQRKNVTKFVLSVLVAASFHASSLFYLLMILAVIRSSWVFIGLSAAAFGLFYYLLLLLIENPIGDFLITKVGSYTTTETSGSTKIGVWTFYLVSILLLYVAHVLIRRRDQAAPHVRGDVPVYCNRNGSLGDSTRAARSTLDSGVLLRVFLLSGFCLPLALANLDFMRIYRNIFVLSAIGLVVAVRSIRDCSSKVLFGSVVVAYVISCFVGLVFYVSFTDIVTPIVSNNVLIVNVMGLSPK